MSLRSDQLDEVAAPARAVPGTATRPTGSRLRLLLLLIPLLVGGLLAGGASGRTGANGFANGGDDHAHSDFDNSDCLDCHGDVDIEADT